MSKHLVISRLWFDDKELMDRYLNVSVKTLIPSLNSQTCQDFTFALIIKSSHVGHVRRKLGIDFLPIEGIEGLRDISHDWPIQTRHDIDDWMAPEYIEEIQKAYNENINLYDTFIIHTQPVKVLWPSGRELLMRQYSETRTSMFATICQKNPTEPIYKGGHGQLYLRGEKVIELRRGLVKWIQHSNSVSNTKKIGQEKVGSMVLSDKSHNWMGGQPVVNIITRTFHRPVSFAACKNSIERQTYTNINHIVGSEAECKYTNAIPLTKKTGPALPWNLHMNDLALHVKSGWVMYLDDDDMFLSDTALEEICAEIENEDQLLLWKVRIGQKVVPNDECFGKIIKRGQISGIGFLFHSKHLPVPWKAIKCGDHHVINHLSKTLQVKWIDKLLTGTQGLSNNHGNTPAAEIVNEPIQKGLVTVGTPTWNNSDIYWLSIESLCRQETTYPWELIVMECPAPKEIGAKYFEPYMGRLKEAGCQRVVYVNQGQKVDLSTKWKEIARHARGEVLILHDSDDYTHPLRIQSTMDQIGDYPWYDSRYAWHYNVPDRKMMLYDLLSTGNKWKTGFNIGVKTDLVRSMPDPKINRGIHSWMIKYVDRKFVDEVNYPCLATTGLNTVSLARRKTFDKPETPYVRTDQTIHDIGLPEDIVERLLDTKEVSAIEIERTKEKVEVEFLIDYCRLYKKGQRKRINKGAYYRLLSLGHVRMISEDYQEPITVEL